MTDDQMDIDPPAQPANAMAALMAGAKGKAKAGNAQALLTEKERQEAEAREGLPWWVRFAIESRTDRRHVSKGETLTIRVEKYRPVTLDDVVSHQDITATSGSGLFASSG
jgi:replication factor C subunit 3/5